MTSPLFVASFNVWTSGACCSSAEAALRLSAAPHDILVVADDDGITEATDTSAYAARYDMIAVCSLSAPSCPRSSRPRRESRCGGERHQQPDAAAVHRGQSRASSGGLDRSPLTLIFDRASIHEHTQQIMEAFHDRGSQAITVSFFLPTLPSTCLLSTAASSTTGRRNAAATAPLRETTSSRS